PSSAPAALSTLSLHDALPISGNPSPSRRRSSHGPPQQSVEAESNAGPPGEEHGEDEQVHEPVLADEVRRLEHRPAREVVLRHHEDRKSTRLNSSHRTISYAVF